MRLAPAVTAVCCALLLIPALAGPGSAGERLVYERKAVVDEQGFQMEVLSMLVPEGWDFQGSMKWDMQSSPPAPSMSLEVVSPDGQSRFTLFPDQSFFWSQDPNLQYSWSQMGTEILQPLRAEEYITGVYLPRVRGGAESLEIEAKTQLPEAARSAQRIDEYHMQAFHSISPFTFPFQLGTDSARVQCRFRQGGVQWVEDVTATVHYMDMSMAGMYGPVSSTSWRVETLSFLAPQRDMQEHAPHLRVMLDSLKPNPSWALANIKLAATVTRQRIQAQQAWFNAMQEVRRSQLEVSDMINRSYEDRNAAYDRIFDDFSQYIRSVDEYADPVNERRVELPNGYDNAWTNGDVYILSDEPGYDPNIGSTQQWQRMPRQE